jgi:ribose transport system ATP-binding protein
MNTPLLEFAGVEKSFFGVNVLKGISFKVPRGSIVGLVGENGAGKSTLMNILGGNLPPDKGTLRYNGAKFAPANPFEAAIHGIAFIHQELNLFLNLTVAENLFLTRLPRHSKTPFVDRSLIKSESEKLLREVGLEISPDRLVETLSAGERQLVEIAKALGSFPRLIIFDEPTTSLSLRESERLFALISILRSRGITMIYISHSLGDVLRLCDEIVVLRDGEVTGLGPAPGFNSDKLVSLMIGRKIEQLFPNRKAPLSPKTLLEVRNLSQPGMAHDISFTLRQGEVLGLGGLMGSGRTELVRILFGLDPHKEGTVLLEGKPLRGLSPSALIARGMAFLTENRQIEGLCLDASLAENLTLSTLVEHSRTPIGWLSFNSLLAAVQRIRNVVKIDPKTSNTQPVRTLSGGNQQKVVLGKWLLRNPRLLILDEPTRGIDVGAKSAIYELIQELASAGTGIIVIASEMEELLGLCDRVLIMRNGSIVDELERPDFDRARILRAALGSSPLPEVA